MKPENEPTDGDAIAIVPACSCGRGHRFEDAHGLAFEISVNLVHAAARKGCCTNVMTHAVLVVVVVVNMLSGRMRGGVITKDQATELLALVAREVSAQPEKGEAPAGDGSPAGGEATAQTSG